MDYICSVCSGTFARKDILLRHMRNIHKKDETNFDLDTPIQFRHPFTKIVAGPTGCGKTTYVVDLIDRAEQLINPPPQRTVWFFKQWQPLYAEIKRKQPHIEFVMGLCDDLMNPDYFDGNVTNLVVIDDLMADLNKAVTLLYTAGSHHKNISIITLQQNIFPPNGESRTMSLNSHYLVLFKNPRDQRQISVLASQMYPGKTHTLLDIYKQATENPFGYLVVDLKQETEDGSRLKPNALQQVAESVPYTSFQHFYNTAGSSTAQQRQDMSEFRPNTIVQPSQKVATYPGSMDDVTLRNPSVLHLPHCKDCGTVLITTKHADIHQKYCQYEDTGKNEPHAEDLKENYTFSTLKQNVLDVLKKEADTLYEKYTTKGLSEKDITQKLKAKLYPKAKYEFLNDYGEIIRLFIEVKDADVHREIVEEIEFLVDQDMSLSRAIRKTLAKYSYIADEMFNDEASIDGHDSEDADTSGEMEEERSEIL